MIMTPLRKTFTKILGDINKFTKTSIYPPKNPLNRERQTLTRATVVNPVYKKNVPRKSPAIKNSEEFANFKANVRVYDPFVPSIETKVRVFASVEGVEEALRGAECAIFLVDHDLFRGISLEAVKGLMASQVIVDGKNLFAGAGEGVVCLGIGRGKW